MKLLEQYILRYGEAINKDVLKVDYFLNHQIDPSLMMELAKDFANHFKNISITKICTVETSGIAPSIMLGYLLKVPVVFFKKNTSKIISKDAYKTNIHSFTKDIDYEIFCSKKYLNKTDSVLFIDDFMANGEACLGAIDIINQSNAALCGIGIVIEKSFQSGRKKLEERGYEVYSQARIASLDCGKIEFIND